MGSILRNRLIPRQVYIWLRPPPRNISETRLVLRELQKFGEVATFFNLKYDFRPNSRTQARAILAIFESERSAAEALAASPLIIDLPRDGPPVQIENPEQSPETLERGDDFDIDETSGDAAPAKPPPVEVANPPELPDIDDKELMMQEEHATPLEPGKMYCTIFPSEHNHFLTVTENPYYRSFKVSTSWLEVRDLVHKYNKEIQGGIPQVALADCFARRKRAIPYRIQDRVARHNEAINGNSLMKMWEDGKRKREEV